jgi:hypothetical protein
LFSFEWNLFSEVEAALCLDFEKENNSNASEMPVLLLVPYEIFTISLAAVKRNEYRDERLDTKPDGQTD